MMILPIQKFLRGKAAQGASRHFLALLALIVLTGSGCASVLNPGPPPARMQLAPAMPGHVYAKPINRQIIISTPVAGREVDSDSISLVFANREVKKLANARWTDTVPFLVQRNLIATFVHSNALRGVGDESAGILADARLLTDLQQFSLRYAQAGDIPTAVFEATFRILGSSTGRLLATKNIKTEVPASGSDKHELVKALEQAFSEALEQVTPWAVEAVRSIR